MRVWLSVLKEFEQTGCTCVKTESHDYGNGMGSSGTSVDSKCPICHGLGFTLKEINTTYKVGDFAYHEFTLVQVVEVNNGHVNLVDEGGIKCGGRDLEKEMVPLTIDNKVISENFHGIYDVLQSKGSTGLNYPAFHREMEDMWYEACTNPDRSSELIAKATKFVWDILSMQSNTQIEGIPLMR